MPHRGGMVSHRFSRSFSRSSGIAGESHAPDYRGSHTRPRSHSERPRIALKRTSTCAVFWRMLIPFPLLNRSKMPGWVNSRLVGKPEVIDGPRGQLPISRITGQVVWAQFHLSGYRVYQACKKIAGVRMRGRGGCGARTRHIQGQRAELMISGRDRSSARWWRRGRRPKRHHRGRRWR